MFKTAPPPRSFTAAEFYFALEPHRLTRMDDVGAFLDRVERSAHGIAVAAGYVWSARGRYPMDVWMEVYRRDQPTATIGFSSERP